MYTIGGNRAADPATTLPAIVIAAEQYGRIARTLAKNIPVTIEADIKNTYHPNPPVFNIVGEIPGTDKADEVVLLGAHFDTWHAATGAADDGNGTAAMMEAMRILKATGVKLRRTVRIGLWEAEEQGLIGSREYVSVHYGGPAGRPGRPPGAPARGAGGRGGAQGPLVLKPEHAKFCVYFNIDNGTGALRGIYTQGNERRGADLPRVDRTVPHPGHDDGDDPEHVRHRPPVVRRRRAARFPVHPGPDRIQHVIHHTNMDTYERLQPRDNIQMATIVAGFAYLAANRDRVAAAQAAVGPGRRRTRTRREPVGICQRQSMNRRGRGESAENAEAVFASLRPLRETSFSVLAGGRKGKSSHEFHELQGSG